MLAFDTCDADLVFARLNTSVAIVAANWFRRWSSFRVTATASGEQLVFLRTPLTSARFDTDMRKRGEARRQRKPAAAKCGDVEVKAQTIATNLIGCFVLLFSGTRRNALTYLATHQIIRPWVLVRFCPSNRRTLPNLWLRSHRSRRW